MSWTVTRSPAQGTRRMILVYQIGVAHRVSLQGVELAKSGSQIRIFSGRTADMSVLANHKTAQVRAVCFSGVQARTLPIALMTERMCRRLVVCARCFAEVCVCIPTSPSLVHWTGAQAARAGYSIASGLKIDPSMAGLLFLPRSSSSCCSVSLIAP